MGRSVFKFDKLDLEDMKKSANYLSLLVSINNSRKISKPFFQDKIIGGSLEFGKEKFNLKISAGYSNNNRLKRAVFKTSYKQLRDIF